MHVKINSPVSAYPLNNAVQQPPEAKKEKENKAKGNDAHKTLPPLGLSSTRVASQHPSESQNKEKKPQDDKHDEPKGANVQKPHDDDKAKEPQGKEHKKPSVTLPKILSTSGADQHLSESQNKEKKPEDHKHDEPKGANVQKPHDDDKAKKPQGNDHNKPPVTLPKILSTHRASSTEAAGKHPEVKEDKDHRPQDHNGQGKYKPSATQSASTTSRTKKHTTNEFLISTTDRSILHTLSPITTSSTLNNTTRTRKHKGSLFPIHKPAHSTTKSRLHGDIIKTTDDKKKKLKTTRPARFVYDHEPLSCYPEYLYEHTPKWWGTQTIPHNKCYTTKKNKCKDWSAHNCYVKVGPVHLIYFPPPPKPKGNATLTPAPTTLYDTAFDYTL